MKKYVKYLNIHVTIKCYKTDLRIKASNSIKVSLLTWQKSVPHEYFSYYVHLVVVVFFGLHKTNCYKIFK